MYLEWMCMFVQFPINTFIKIWRYVPRAIVNSKGVVYMTVAVFVCLKIIRNDNLTVYYHKDYYHVFTIY